MNRIIKSISFLIFVGFFYNLFASTLPPEFFSMVKKKISFYYFYPQKARENNWQGVVWIKAKIDREGKIKDIKILRSSGYAILDNTAQWLVKSSAPYPPPEEITTPQVSFIIPVEFKIEKRRRIETIKKELEKLSYRKRMIRVPAKLREKGGETSLKKSSQVSSEKAKIEEMKISLSPQLSTLFEIAQNNSYPLKITKDQIKLAKRKIKEVRREFFPYAGIEYSSTEGETITDTYESKSYGIRLQHILYDNGQRKFSLKRERLNVEVAEQNYKKAYDELLFNVLKAYYYYQKEAQALKKIKETDERFDAFFDLGKTLKENRLITQVEFLRIQSLYNQLKAKFIAQEGRYKLSIANLKKILGIDPEEKLSPPSLVSFKEDIKIEELLSEYIKKGLKSRPEVILWGKSVEATKLAYKITKLENRPKLILESFWGRSGEAYGYQSLDLADTWSVVGKVVWLFGGSSFETSLAKEKTVPTEITEISTKTEANVYSFKFNILDKMKYLTEVLEGKVALKQAKDELTKLKKDIIWEIQEGFFTYKEAKKRIESIKKEKQTYLKELEIKKELFQAGETTLSDIMQTELKKLDTEISLLKANLDMYLGLIQLDKAAGFTLNIVEKL